VAVEAPSAGAEVEKKEEKSIVLKKVKMLLPPTGIVFICKAKNGTAECKSGHSQSRFKTFVRIKITSPNEITVRSA
jgi:hypothetical protein